MAIVGLVIVIVFLLTCNGSGTSGIKGEPEVISEKTTTEKFHKEETKERVDTFYIEGEMVNVPVYIHDTVLLPSEPIPFDLDTFYAHIVDSVIDASIMMVSETRPYINFEYKTKNLERTIEKTIWDSTHTETIKKVRVNQVYFGGEAVIYPGVSSVFAGVDFVSKKGWQAEVGAGVNFNDMTPMVKVGFKPLFSFRRKKNR
jgi:hypothetical protein